MAAAYDLVGKMLGRLLVLSKTYRGKNNSKAYECLCSCGEKTFVFSRNLTRKNKPTISCGCLAKEKASQMAKSRTTHGQSVGGRRSKTFTSYTCMLERCNNPNNKNYGSYGGRGIKVCDRWQESLQNFIEDMGEAPNGMEIDRINNDKGYSKENCKWSTRREQTNNTRRTVYVDYKGKKTPISIAAELAGINYYTAHDRHKRGVCWLTGILKNA